MVKRVLKQLAGLKKTPRLLYILFFIVAFFISFYLTFPVDSIKQRVLYEIQRTVHFSADISSVSVYPVSTVKLSGVRIYTKGSFLDIRELYLKPSVFSLVSGRLRIPFKALVLGGEVKGSFVYNPSLRKIEGLDIRFVNLNIEKLPSFISSAAGSFPEFSASGFLSGSLHVELLPEVRGNFSFNIDRLGIQNLKVKGVVFPPFTDLESSFKGYIEDGITRVDELRFEGDEIKLALAGVMPLPWEIRKGGKIDLGFKLRLTGSKLGVLKTFLAPHLVPQGDGSLGGKIAGTIYNPKVIKEPVDF